MDNQILRGDIFYADLAGCFGSEQGGLRPVLVIQNNLGNKYSPTTHAAPLTSKLNKSKLPTHIFIDSYEYGLKSDSVVLMEQIRVADKKRLKSYITSLDEEKMCEVDNAIAVSFGIADRVAV